MPRVKRTGELTGTSFALLGLLASRSSGFSAYELTRQMARSLHYVWPRAERNLYDEIKLLADRGLARTRNETVGRRPRTSYTITAKGRRALQTWLKSPPAPLMLESEALLHVFFAEHASVDELLAAIRSVREEAVHAQDEVAELVADYDRDGGPFPERLHVIALMGKMLHLHRQALKEWANWAEAEVSQWTSTALGDGAHVPAGVFSQLKASD